MPTIKELIKQRITRLESVPATLQTAIEKQQEKVFKQLLKDLNALEIENGKYVASKENLAKIAGITEQLKQNLFNKEYLEAIKAFALEIQVQARLTNQIMSELGDFEDNDLYKAIVKKAQQNALLLLDENAIAAEIVQPLSDLLTNSVVSNVGYLDAVESLRNFMLGNGDDISGALAKYAGAYVKDAFAVSDRQYAKLIAEDLGFQFYEYSGVEVEGTRYFCCIRKGNIYHKKEIESWGDNESLWNKGKEAECADKKGGGRNPNTNASTIFSYLGGYNCNHVLIPVSTRFVPVGDIARAKAKGYYV